MPDVFIVPNNKEEVLKYLNLVLQNHSDYESWMKFDDFQIKGPIKIPRYRSPKEGETKLSKSQYEGIYKSVAAQVLGG
jgi:hypothetical protein